MLGSQRGVSEVGVTLGPALLWLQRHCLNFPSKEERTCQSSSRSAQLTTSCCLGSRAEAVLVPGSPQPMTQRRPGLFYPTRDASIRQSAPELPAGLALTLSQLHGSLRSALST